MKKQFIILAPDTDCGKTFATATLLKKAINENINAMACKPIQTGSLDSKSQDLDFILKTANLSVLPEIYSKLVLCTLKTPASALLASKIEKQKINLDEIIKKIREISQNYDLFFVETAGGIYSPITESTNNIYLAKKLGFPAIMCVPNRVGAISLSAMTAKILFAEKIKIEGAIFTQTIKPKNEIDETICRDNIETFEKITGVKIIADIKFKKEF
ncbi:MAG: dethiobiotin synthase [Chitinivibrionia bacterium]|nr:dethiobiotin synthase [Chitinivibrionia bacterium]